MEADEWFGWIGRPKPLAKEVGSAKPARPKRVISAVPIRIARHSAGGGRLAKRLRVVDDILGGCGLVGCGGGCVGVGFPLMEMELEMEVRLVGGEMVFQGPVSI